MDLSSKLAFGVSPKVYNDNMLPLAHPEDEPRFGAIFVDLFVSATLRRF